MVQANSLVLTTDILSRIMSLESEVKALIELTVNMSFGLHGHIYLTDAESSTSGDYFSAMQILTDSTSIQYKELNSGTISETLNKGDVVYGAIYDVTITTGDARLYRRNFLSNPM